MNKINIDTNQKREIIATDMLNKIICMLSEEFEKYEDENSSLYIQTISSIQVYIIFSLLLHSPSLEDANKLHILHLDFVDKIFKEQISERFGTHQPQIH